MTDIFSFLSKIGIPGVVLSIIYLLFKSGPITLFTSTAIERKILSKEKKTIIVLGEYLLKSVAITICYSGITFGFLNNKELYNEVVLSLGLIFLFIFLLFILVYTGIFNRSINDLLRNRTKNQKMIIIILLFFVILISLLSLPYMIGTQAIPNFEASQSVEFDSSEIIMIIISMLLVYFFFSLFLILPVMKMINAFFDLNDKENERLYIEEKLDGELIKWYVYYSSNNKMVFVGNAKDPRKSDKFKFIPIENVYKTVLKIEKS